MGRNQVGIALVWLILFSNSVLQIRCSLSAYSETRSFRDALEGRSMEEALSGPVDRDTSSYGDRTSSLSGSPSATTSSQSPASSMMLSIPANGNLQQQQVEEPQQQAQQQKSMNGRDSELERETGPISDGLGGSPMEGQQQLMEQKQFGRQLAQTARRMAGRYMQMQLQKQNARQQQQVDDSSSFGSKSTTNGESGFGEEPQSGGGKRLESKMSDSSSLTTPSYSSSRQQVEQSKQAADSNEDQPGTERQQQMNVVEQQAVERGYSSSDTADQQQQQAVKQRAMAAMLMSMNNAMKYSQRSPANMMTTTIIPTLAAQMPIQQQQQQVSDSPSNIDNFENTVKGSSMARDPMQMSLGNSNKQMAYGPTNMQANQRQIAPPMMISTLMNEMNQQNNFNEQAPAGKLKGSRGGMRRASQRKVEKKMSPAMVNAMLNKMLNLKPSVNNDNGNNEQQGYIKPAAMAMLMRSPAGAELLANMAMGPQMVGAVAGMPTAKREQYKRMMMAAIMQQAGTAMAEGRGNDYSSGANQQQQLNDSYSTTEQSVTKSAKNGARSGSSSSSRGYGTMTPTMSSSQMAPLSPVAVMMNSVMNGARGSFGSYEQNSQEQQQVTEDATTTMTPENLAGRMARKTMNSKSGNRSYARKMIMSSFNDQQQQQVVSGGGKSSGMARSTAINRKPVSMMTNSMAYAMGPMSMSSATTDSNSGMNNGRGMKTSSGGNGASEYTERQQQQLDEQQKKNPAGYGDSEQQQQELMPPSKFGPGEGEQMNEQMGGMNSYASMMGGQQEMTMSTQSPASPRQNLATRLQKSSYRPQMRQQQGMSSSGGLSAGSVMGSSKGAQMPVQQLVQDDFTTSMPMARPMPVHMSYGANSKDQQQQQLDENSGSIEQQQKEIDEFGGSAPMGMAEPFAFDYKVEDDYGNGHYRKEESDKNGVVRGSYGYMDVNGLYRHVDYVADENGFRANVKSNEPGLSSETSQTNSGATSSVGNSNSLMSNSAQNSPSSSTAQLEVNNQMMSMDAPSDSTPATIQQQQQQMLPTQAELNENGEK